MAFIPRHRKFKAAGFPVKFGERDVLIIVFGKFPRGFFRG
jgi:hypothetical protein